MASWRAAVFVMIILAIALLAGLLPFCKHSRVTAAGADRTRLTAGLLGALPPVVEEWLAMGIDAKLGTRLRLDLSWTVGPDGSPADVRCARGPAGPPPPSVPRTR